MTNELNKELQMYIECKRHIIKAQETLKTYYCSILFEKLKEAENQVNKRIGECTK